MKSGTFFYNSVFLLFFSFVLWGCDGNSRLNQDPGKTPTINLTPAPSLVSGGHRVDLHADISSSDQITWVQTAGPTVTLSGANTGTPYFTVPDVNARQTVTFELRVRSGSETTTQTLSVDIQPSGLAVDAGRDQLVNEGATVTLHAKGQSSSPGATYSWTQISGSPVTLSGASTANPSFAANVPYQSPTDGSLGTFDGNLVFRITITEAGTGRTTYEEVKVDVQAPVQANENVAPTVTAGLDQIVRTNHLVHLHAVAQGGTASAAGSAGYTYVWTQTNIGIGPTATLNNPTSANPDFTPTAPGRYVFEVTVTDVNSKTATDSVVIDVSDTLSVSLGRSGSIPAGAKISLHPIVTGGTGNFSYQWSSDKSITYSSGSATDANPVITYTPTKTEQVTFTLTVTDNGIDPAVSDSSSKTIAFLVPIPVNSVDAGIDKTVAPGDQVSLHALADPDRGVAYQWQAPAGITLSDANTTNALFTAPVTEGDYAFTVTARTKVNSVTDTVTIKVQIPASSNAGTDKTVTQGDTVHLHGAGAHGSGNYTYLWSVVSPANAGGGFDDATSNNPIFTPGNGGIVYTLQLTVTDSGTNTPVTDTVDISVREIMTVDAGQDKTVQPGHKVTLHAVADKPGASFQWSETAPTGITINNAVTDNADFTAPAAQQGYPFEVEASKPLTVTATDGVTITVQDPVTTNAGQNKTVTKGHLVRLNGSAAHGIGPYTYQWSSINAPETVTFSDAASDNPSFTPNTAGNYKLDLQVTDSTPVNPQVVHDTVTITVLEALTVNAGTDQSVKAGITVQLRPTQSGGVGSFAYAWTLPAGVSLENGTMLTDQNIDVTYNPAATENKTLTLAVTDTGDNNTVVSDSINLGFVVIAPASPLAAPVSDDIAVATAVPCPAGQERVFDFATGKITANCGPPINPAASSCTINLNNPEGRPAPAGAILKAYKCGDGSKGSPAAKTCEKLYDSRPPAACGPNELPYTKIVNADWGYRSWESGCMSLQQCQQDWITDTASKPQCASFSFDNIYTEAFTCTYCCVGDACNRKENQCAIVPGTAWNPTRP